MAVSLQDAAGCVFVTNATFALPGVLNGADTGDLELLSAMENYEMMNLVLIYFSIAKVNF